MTLTPAQLAELSEQREEVYQTRRPTSEALERMLYEVVPVLDHGFVRVVDYMGDDSSIVQAARVSYGRGTRRSSEDAGLIRYLMRHHHTTPFEMCEMKFHVKLPIFVARQWIRHRTANVNEYSARYSILDREFYIPEPEHLAVQSTANRQGRGEILGENEARWVLDTLRADAGNNFDHYLELLNEGEDGKTLDANKSGLARELARMNLTLNLYTQWYWKVDLHNLFHFLRLRADEHAQYEIRAYADEMLKIVQAWVPHAHEAFEEYVSGSFTLSRTMKRVVKRMLQGEHVSQEASRLSAREWAEFQKGLAS